MSDHMQVHYTHPSTDANGLSYEDVICSNFINLFVLRDLGECRLDLSYF